VAYTSRPASRWLAPYVERLWSLSEVAAHERERIVPSGTFELVVNLDRDEIVVRRGHADARHSGAVVSGACSRSFVVDTRVHRSIVGVHFRPGGAARFLGVPAIELADTHVDLDVLWGREAGHLRDSLCSADSAATRFDRIEAALERRMAPEPGRPMVRAAVTSLSRSAHGVGALVSASGLSHRRFVDVFAREVGMTPKRFARVARLQRALARVRPGMSWAAIALEAGYSDQSHLIRELEDFTEMTPREYARRRSDSLLDHHVLSDASISSKTKRTFGT
jgi:AraC-like DNA-binding protein